MFTSYIPLISNNMHTKRLFFLFVMGLLCNGMMAENYNIYIAGTQVTDDNKDDVLGNGTVSYNPSTHTLLLNRANIQTTEHGILCKNGNYTIRLKQDDSTIRCTDVTTEHNAVCVEGGTLTIENETNDCVLTVGSKKNSAIVADNITLNRGASVEASSEQNCAVRLNGTLSMEQASLHATGNKAIVGCKRLTLHDSYLRDILSTDAHYDSGTQKFLQNYNNQEANELMIWDKLKVNGAFFRTDTERGEAYLVQAPAQWFYTDTLVIPESIQTEAGTLRVVEITTSALDNDHDIKLFVTGNSVQRIQNRAFLNCKNLEKVVIGESVDSIGFIAFAGCYQLRTVVCKAVTPPVLPVDASMTVFDGAPLSEATLYVPAESVETYQAAAEWQDFGTILPMREGEALHNVTADTQVQKVLEDGQMVIIRNGIRYNVVGTVIR